MTDDKTVLYASVGASLIQFDVDVAAAVLTRRETVQSGAETHTCSLWPILLRMTAGRISARIANFCVDRTWFRCVPEDHPVIPRSKTPESGGQDCASRNDKPSQD